MSLLSPPIQVSPPPYFQIFFSPHKTSEIKSPHYNGGGGRNHEHVILKVTIKVNIKGG